MVVVEHRDDQGTPDRGLLHIQFWFFYGFNGPGKFHLTIGDITDVHVEIDTCGRHYGDWEHVTLELEPVGEEWRLRRVKLSRHSFTIWKDYLSPLERKGIERLKIYVARDSHGHYERPGNHDYSHSKHVDFKLGKLDVWLYDMAGNGAEFATSDPSHYEIVSSDFAAHEVPEPAWLSFDGHWGQFEKLEYRLSDLSEELGDLAKFFAGSDPRFFAEVGTGPVGPKRHGTDFGATIRYRVGVTTVDGNPYAFVVGTDGHLWSNRWTGTERSWYDHGAPSAGLKIDGPVGVTEVEEHPYAFVVGTDGHLWSNRWTSTEWSWYENGAPAGLTIAGPVGVTKVEEHPYVFVVGSDGHLWCQWWTGTEWSWDDLGPPPDGRIAAGVGATMSGQYRNVFVLDTHQNLWVCWWDGQKWLWSCLGDAK